MDTRRPSGAALIVVLACSLLFSAVPPASAGTGIGMTPNFPPTATVGQTGLPASLTITNVSSPPESVGTVALTSILLVPSCGTAMFGDLCPTGSRDPGVFALGGFGTGAVGTACAGTTFAIGLADAAEGRFQFTPTGPPVILQPPGTAGDRCTINFTFDVLRAPARDAFPPQPGFQTSQIARASGTSSVSGVPGTGTGTDAMTVTRATPVIVTNASGSVPLGGQISDTATLSGGSAPTGTITFSAFGPDDATCTRTPAFVSAPRAVSGNGSYGSGPFTPTAAGTYRWTADYSGDLNNEPVTSPCNAPNESVLVSARVSPPAVAGRVINGTPGKDRLVGTPGNDVITCGEGDDFVEAGAGDDVVNCGAGNDTVDAGTGNDRVDGGSGNDRLVGGPGVDQLAGGSGNDVISAGSANDRVDGGDGDDTISGNEGDDALKGAAGNDRIFGNEGDDSLGGGAGQDRLGGNSGKDRAAGGAGRDTIGGGSGNDRLSGDSGTDRVSGDSGRDSVAGGGGPDRLFGGSGRDVLRGGSGNDSLRGGPGRDRLIGGPGRDDSRQ